MDDLTCLSCSWDIVHGPPDAASSGDSLRLSPGALHHKTL